MSASCVWWCYTGINAFRIASWMFNQTNKTTKRSVQFMVKHLYIYFSHRFIPTTTSERTTTSYSCHVRAFAGLPDLTVTKTISITIKFCFTYTDPLCVLSFINVYKICSISGQYIQYSRNIRTINIIYRTALQLKINTLHKLRSSSNLYNFV